MAFSNGYTLGFAAVVCVVCAVGVSSASMSLRPLQDANKTRALQAKVLSALDVHGEGDQPLVGTAIDEAYAARVELRVVDDKGEVIDKSYDDVIAARAAVKGTANAPGLYPVYVRKDGDKVGAYAIEMNGKGLWGPLSGYLAIEPDGQTVLGATFDAPKETPGLGAEIMSPPFQDAFHGKKIADKGGKTVPIDVAKGSAELVCPGRVEHCVDGVSGATITSRGTDAMIEDALLDYEPWLAKIKSGGAR